MDKNQFWSLIDDVVCKVCQPNLKTIELKKMLTSMSQESIVDFYIQFNNRVNESDIPDIYGAGSILNENYLSDDSFKYFRYWLISMGRESFERALANPDSMAGLEVPMERDGHPNPTNEGFYYAIYDAFEQVTGTHIYREQKVLDWEKQCPDETDFDWKIYSNIVLERKFPLLWGKYLEKNKGHGDAYSRFSISSN